VQKTVVLHCHPPLKNKVREQLPEFHLSYWDERAVETGLLTRASP
jgi:hypothetical protein